MTWAQIDLKEARRKVVVWVDLAQDRDQWWDHVNTVMNFQGP
jgi:hypothetical protein